METIKELSKLVNGRVESLFDFSVNKDKRFTIVVLSEAPSVDDVRIALQAGYEFVAKITPVRDKNSS